MSGGALSHAAPHPQPTLFALLLATSPAAGCDSEDDGCKGEECSTTTEDGQSCATWPTYNQGYPLELSLEVRSTTALSRAGDRLALGDLDDDGVIDAAVLDSTTREVAWSTRSSTTRSPPRSCWTRGG